MANSRLSMAEMRKHLLAQATCYWPCAITLFKILTDGQLAGRGAGSCRNGSSRFFIHRSVAYRLHWRTAMDGTG